MSESKKEIIYIGVGLLVLWGIVGLVKGDGFFEGIEKQIDAIGDIVSWLIKVGLAFLVLWFIITNVKKK